MPSSSMPAASSKDGLDALPAEHATAGLSSLRAPSASVLIPDAIRMVLESGHRVGGSRPSFELINQQLCLTDPRHRILSAEGSSFNLAVAVARFVWHADGNSRLSAIGFYEPRARLFSDDGNVLPGSNSGARLFGADSGVDQVRGIIERIRADSASRRGSAVVWRPQDAMRESRDIPCALALTCHLRGGELLTTLTMRSNNALRLLPYNIFEFSMLAELIAAELDVEMGPYWHVVNSLHVYEDELEPARTVSAPTNRLRDGSPPMIPIPRDGRALHWAAELARCETLLRTAVSNDDWRALDETIRRATKELPEYWLGLFYVLTLFATARRQVVHRVDVEDLLARVPMALRTPLTEVLGR